MAFITSINLLYAFYIMRICRTVFARLIDAVHHFHVDYLSTRIIVNLCLVEFKKAKKRTMKLAKGKITVADIP